MKSKSPYCELTLSQLKAKSEWVNQYFAANNAADGSAFDPNANITSKSLATADYELFKDFKIQLNRHRMGEYIEHFWGTDELKSFHERLKHHRFYIHDETHIMPYCASISLYPMLQHGSKVTGGPSNAPKNLGSFCGIFVNVLSSLAQQFAGALATVEFLMYFDYFATISHGADYLTTDLGEVHNRFQQVVYTINEPLRNGSQSLFWNISVYDRSYFESLFGNFYFPDGSQPNYDSILKLQEAFLDWFREERLRTNTVLTFPVITAALLSDGEKPKDVDFANMLAEQQSRGSSFFYYISESADSLSSCCRLRNEMADNTFSYSLGAGGVSTGSIKVITLNFNRLIQDSPATSFGDFESAIPLLREEIRAIHRYLVSFRRLVEHYKKVGALPAYDANYISLDKQYLTIGINGLVESAEYLGIKPNNNEEYKTYAGTLLKVIFDENKKAKEEYKYMFNTEFVPAESLGVKNAKWDKKDGYFVPRDCYNSYFYSVEDEEVTDVDKLVLHGKEINQYLDGGSALHLNLNSHLSKSNALALISMACKTGCNYYCINVASTICNVCEHHDITTLQKCNVCGSTDIDYVTRVIGYHQRVAAWSTDRQMEHKRRHYHRVVYAKNSSPTPCSET